MGFSDNPNGSDFTIVTDVLLYSVFATLAINQKFEQSVKGALILQPQKSGIEIK